MKAMLLEQIAPIESSPLRLAELPLPEPAAGEVRMKVRCCGVCRTDLHVVEGDLPPQKMPVMPGHQIVGTVDALGPDCRAAASGAADRRAPGCAGPAAGAGSARSGARTFASRPDSPATMPTAATPSTPSCRRRSPTRSPTVFGDVEAAPLLCAGIIGYRALKRSQLPPGGRLAMYGFGSSAHVLIQIALHRGCEVYVVTRDEKHRELARQMGAVWVGAGPEEMPVKVDSAILFAPAGELVPPALEKLEKGGTLALAGIYMTPIPAMDYERYVFYERDIHRSPATRGRTAANCWPRPPQSRSARTRPSIPWPRPTAPCRTSRPIASPAPAVLVPEE